MFFAARAAHQKDPTPETLAALTKARSARGAYLTDEDVIEREQLLLHMLILHGDAKGTELFADEMGISLRMAREWRDKALKDRRPSVEAYRDYARHRLDGIATMALAAGEFGEAARAVAQAAKLAGVSEKIEIRAEVTTAEPSPPPVVEQRFAALGQEVTTIVALLQINILDDAVYRSMLDRPEAYAAALIEGSSAAATTLRRELPDVAGRMGFPSSPPVQSGAQRKP